MTLRNDSAGRPVFANGAPMDLDAAEQAHRRLYARPAPLGLCTGHAHLRARLSHQETGIVGDPGGALIVPAERCKVCHPAQPAAVAWSGPLAAPAAAGTPRPWPSWESVMDGTAPDAPGTVIEPDYNKPASQR